MSPTTRGPSTSKGDTTGSERRWKKGLCSNEDPHGGELIEHANKGVGNEEAGHVSKMGQTNKAPNAGVKGEFVEKQVPLDGKSTSWIGRVWRKINKKWIPKVFD